MQALRGLRRRQRRGRRKWGRKGYSLRGIFEGGSGGDALGRVSKSTPPLQNHPIFALLVRGPPRVHTPTRRGGARAWSAHLHIRRLLSLSGASKEVLFNGSFRAKWLVGVPLCLHLCGSPGCGYAHPRSGISDISTSRIHAGVFCDRSTLPHSTLQHSVGTV